KFSEIQKRRRRMNKIDKFFVTAALAALVTPAAQPASEPVPEAFAKLRSMVGHWEAESTKGERSTLDIELTAGGSAILERSHETVEGQPVEMTTVYYLDGDKVQLTHYCMAGNQPTMRGSYSPETKTLTFDFVGATNLKSPNDGHMHHA